MVPLVIWEPINPSDTSCSNWELQTIIDGKHDAYINDWAAAAASSKHTILLRFAHEMNGYWFTWGDTRCSNTPDKFKQAWLHVWNIFQAKHATNVKFVWNPSGRKNLGKFYPGDAYVNYVGITAFNWGGYSSLPWRSMVTAFKQTMTPLANAGISKPIIVAETGSAPDKTGCSTCSKSKWITDGYQAAYTKWPKIKAIVYFDVNMLPITNNEQPNWRLNNPPAAQTSYSTIAHLLKFQGTIPSV
jgi:beta-mannanase